MNLFQKVKGEVTTRQAAEAYGYEVSKNGIMCCPFHGDKNPSMKVDERYYCFGCQATGDVIDFISKVFGIRPLEAVAKLIYDFKLDVQNCKQEYVNEEKKTFKSIPLEKRATDILLEYLQLLREWETRYAPATADSEWSPLFCEALMNKAKVEYLLDLLMFGDDEEKQFVYNEYRKEIEKYERRVNEYRTGSGNAE